MATFSPDIARDAAAIATEAVELGAAALLVASSCPNGHSPSHVALDRVWATAQEAGVPIVAIKTGRSSRAAEINMSHTASLAGEDRLYEAMFGRLGIVRCFSVTQFLETLKFLSIVGPLPDRTVGSMSCSGGEASLVADYSDAAGLDMPRLSDSASTRLAEILGSAG